MSERYWCVTGMLHEWQMLMCHRHVVCSMSDKCWCVCDRHRLDWPSRARILQETRGDASCWHLPWLPQSGIYHSSHTHFGIYQSGITRFGIYQTGIYHSLDSRSAINESALSLSLSRITHTLWILSIWYLTLISHTRWYLWICYPSLLSHTLSITPLTHAIYPTYHIHYGGMSH